MEKEINLKRFSSLFGKEIRTSKRQVHYDNGNLRAEWDIRSITTHIGFGIQSSSMNHGKYVEYYDDGSVCIEGQYKNDVREGRWVVYDRGHSRSYSTVAFLSNDLIEGESGFGAWVLS